MEVDAVNEELETVPHPHDILWYPDGDVVLATDTFLFKVHKCILSLQSSVFRDLFAFPAADGVQGIPGENGAGVQEMYEGLPMVVLAGDKGDEVVHLLRTVYERSYYYRDDDETPLEKIIALLVLSTKYDFQTIRTDVILQVAMQYPMSFRRYGAVDDDEAETFGVAREECHFPLLSACLRADVECLLPLLYYACADSEMEYILEQSNLSNMDPRSILTLVSGRDILKNRINEIVTMLPESIRGIDIQCSSTSKSCRKVAHFTDLEDFCNATDLGDIDGESITDNLQGACERCAMHIAKAVNKKREEIWSELPSFFGLRCWKDLKEELAKLS